MKIPCNLTNCASCIAYLNRECIINKAYKQGRADAIEEFRKKLLSEPTSKYWNFGDMVNQIAEQIKEQKNDNN